MAEPRASTGRYTLRVTISVLVATLLVVTVGGSVGVALFTRHRTRAAMADALLEEATARLAQTLEGRLVPIESLVRETLQLLRDGRLPLDDERELAVRLAERIRFDERFETLAFVRDDGRGGGVVRWPDGRLTAIHVERRPDGELERVDEVLEPDGTWRETGRTTEGARAFREASWYASALGHDEPTWGPPYVRVLDGQPGRGCGASVRIAGETVGVVGTGFSLAFIADFVRDVKVGEAGAVLLLHAQTGEVRVAPSPEVLATLGGAVAGVAAGLEGGVRALPAGRVVVDTVEQDGRTWIVALTRQVFRPELEWINAIVVPEDEVVGFMDRQLKWGLLAVGALLALGIALAFRLARRVSGPLRRIAEDLERVAAFELTPEASPASRIVEVTVVGDATDRMKAGLRSFSRYVPTALVRDLLAQGQEARLGGTVRPLTLFFSDVKGFTTLAEGMETERLIAALGDYLDVVTRTLHAGGGTIDKFMGDGVLAFFNAPHDDPEHPRRACEAALAVQAALADRRPTWAAQGWPDFLTRIGLHTAPVVVGNLGTPDRFAYTVIGDGVNLAARLESLNKAYGTWILASDELRRAAGTGFVWRELDRTAVAGRAEGGAVHELLGKVGAVDDGVLAARDAYESALRDYLARRFDEAARGFDEAGRLRPGDLAAETLGARARLYVAAPPPADWGGVFVQTKK